MTYESVTHGRRHARQADVDDFLFIEARVFQCSIPSTNQLEHWVGCTHGTVGTHSGTGLPAETHALEHLEHFWTANSSVRSERKCSSAFWSLIPHFRETER